MRDAIERALETLHTADREADARASADRIGAPARLLVCLAYLATVVSFGPYDPVLALAAFPLCHCLLEGPSLGRLLRRTAPFLPVALLLGLPSAFLHREPAFACGSITITRGMVAAMTLTLKGVLCILATAQFAAVCGFERIVGALRAFGLPGRAATFLLLSGRHLVLLLSEANRMSAAYALRAPGQRGIAMRAWGPFAGSLLLRSIDRAGTVHDAMSLRGFHDADPVLPPLPRTSWRSVVYVLGCGLAFAAALFFLRHGGHSA